jgi:hypothetical protein
MAVFALLVGTLQMARVAKNTALSDQILEAGIEAARKLISPPELGRSEAGYCRLNRRVICAPKDHRTIEGTRFYADRNSFSLIERRLRPGWFRR